MKKLFLVASALIISTMILSACGTAATPTAAPVQPAAPAATQAPAPTAAPTVAPTEAPADPNHLPRNETMYFNGQQWGAVVCWNPYSNSCNNAMTIAQQDNARILMFETPYIYDMLDGKTYPLLASGPYTWNDAHTEITFKLNPAAHWSDGTPVTADDVAYTWATHVKYNDGVGAGNAPYIDSITAVDPQTVLVKAKLDANGKAINPLLVANYLTNDYVIQKAWTQKLEARVGGDATKLMADTAEDVVTPAPITSILRTTRRSF